MKQMHIGGALFGGTALRRVLLGLHISLSLSLSLSLLYIRDARARVRGAGTRSKTPCGAEYLHIKVTMVSRTVVETALSVDRPPREGMRIFLAFRPVASPIYSLALEWNDETIFFHGSSSCKCFNLEDKMFFPRAVLQLLPHRTIDRPLGAIKLITSYFHLDIFSI